MPHLRLVPPIVEEPATAEGRPHVSLRLLMAASGRCACDECLRAYRRGDKDAGIVRVGCPAPLLTAVR